MTIKRQWLLLLILSAIISVGINSFILSSLINRYFVDYTKSNYEKHYSQIVEFSKKALIAQNYSSQELAMLLKNDLSDPIIGISLYDETGQLLVNIGSGTDVMDAMNREMMNGTDCTDDMDSMMNSANQKSETSWMNNSVSNLLVSSPEETDSVNLSNAGVFLGKLDIVRYSSFGNSLDTKMFKVALICNSIFSFGLVLIFMFVIGTIVSKKMSKDLMNTATLAINMDLGNQINNNLSKVKEIRIIQQSLLDLQSKLKMKQISRKKLIDELVHQSRTPLTILKTHIEGLEDGIISTTPEVIKTCETQIENISSIIANMSGMIDAEKDIDNIKVDEFEINHLLRQIVGGLRVQFEKKNLDLILLSHKKITLKTDKYKLSQCIYNILTNAYKFTEPNGKVTIVYQSDESHLNIMIEDSGSGISIEDKKHLFEAYFRGSNSNNIFGEGIGLYVVNENLKKLNGSIYVESEIDKGSKFVIKIPKQIDL